MDYQEIILKQEEQIAYISLNRPNKLNALTPQMLEELRHALDELSQDDNCRIIVVKGEGKSWSAGVDLSLFSNTKVEPGFKAWEDGDAIIKLLTTMPQVTIAMLNGYCFTGAMELMMGFDLIIAADEAKIGDTHCKWGIPPKWGMTQRLMNQVGMRKAKELSFTAQAISGTEAERIGLVNTSVPLTELEETVEALCMQILENSGQTIAAVKTLYQFGNTHTLAEGLQYELDYEMNPTDKKDNLKNFKKELGK